MKLRRDPQASSGELFGLQTNSILYQISSSGRQVAALSATQFSDGGILQASDGNLWGTFYGGQCSGEGIVFAATTAAHVLHSIVFDCNVDGQHPISMIQASDGKFYGVTFGYGSASTNSVWNGTMAPTRATRCRPAGSSGPPYRWARKPAKSPSRTLAAQRRAHRVSRSGRRQYRRRPIVFLLPDDTEGGDV